jgi:DNA-binding CsgD family transcriptional regulator
VNYSQTKDAVLILIFCVVIISSGLDIFADISHGASFQHILKEAIIFSLSLVALGGLIYNLHKQSIEIEWLKKNFKELENSKKTPKKYVLDGRRNLGEIIIKQFSEWSLTQSEIEIGWLLLKGLSLREISIVRGTQEKTIRQQTSAIYKKAKLEGRHAFSAWFIEDIL